MLKKNKEETYFRFETLHNLPTALKYSQCVSFNDEILICGGASNRNCYSYHIVKNEYRVICCYPSNVKLYGHTVIKMKSNNEKEIKLLSFGGEHNHALVMHYQSVWNEETQYLNKWVASPYKFNNNINDMLFSRALIGGKNNQLLFLIYYPNHIIAYDFKLMKTVAKGMLPTREEVTTGSCFAKSTSDQMIIFGHGSEGICVKYDETKKKFSYSTLVMPNHMDRPLLYSNAYIDDFIMVFGSENTWYKDSVFLYSIKKTAWSDCKRKLPLSDYGAAAVVTEDGKWAHIIGGCDSTSPSNKHMRVLVQEIIGITEKDVRAIVKHWLRKSELKRLGWIDDFYKFVINFWY
ncbi:hypothetical protein RFI_12127 [Reticulomyxa filosa]|uniref:Kelch motif family protein n=1 Tax=Reticulomyxa filosa TaxID=46433 RepID=X6NI41_RETFI|nr:hypothetical protein RFI_12127 [Reticulomyxa filosa]|eukprot:ETO25017.1 hypothetical protein RFI_12127 [Reticulomyxa filosa]